MRNLNTPRVSNRQLVALAAVGLIAFLLAEQVATGWLALGPHINISRRDLNISEWIVIVGSVLWGLFTLWGTLDLARRTESGVRAFFDRESGWTPMLTFSVALLAVIGVGSIILAEQVATGWLALGERINIPRHDLNPVEWAAIVGGIVWGILCLRTVWGFLRRERPSWSWGQWALFLMIIAGVIVFMSGLFDVPKIVPPGGTIFDNIPDLLELLAPSLMLIISCWIAYSYITIEYGQIGPVKDIAGTLSERAKARDVRSARVPAGQAISTRLARNPGAGAIIGFIALFTFFTVASDLFLDPQSLAGALTNNVTRGIIAIGVTMLMIGGEFDLSVGSVLGISGLTFFGLMTGQFPPGSPQLDPLTAAILTLVFAAFLGFLNGIILIRTKIPSFIVTLATLLMLRGIPLVFIAGGKTIRYVDYFDTPPYIYISRVVIILFCVAMIVLLLFIGRSWVITRLAALRTRWSRYTTDDDDFRLLGLIGSALYLLIPVLIALAVLYALGGSIGDLISQLRQGIPFLQISFFDLLNGRIASLPYIGAVPREINLRMGVFWWIVLVAIFQFVLNQTRYGNATFAVGGNAGAALAQGINVNRMKITNFMLVSFLVGIAGILDASRLQSIDALRGQGLELEVIAATVIGGALLSGGYGSMIGALLGVFIFGMMQTGLVLIGVDARLFNAFIGFIILAAVIINTLSRRIRT
jgi:ribose/xylose/arabinose/galactoside ABC-type transport system permease subunit